MKRVVLLCAIVGAGLVGCPPYTPPLAFHWADGQYGSPCQNNESVYITDADAAKVSFQLLTKADNGNFVPTNIVHTSQYGIVENVTIYHVEASYQGYQTYWWDGGYYYWGPYLGRWAYQPVPWNWVTANNIVGHLDASLVVSQMEIVHGDGSYLFATFTALDPGEYRVRITGVNGSGRAFEAVQTDAFTVDPCSACGRVNLAITSVPPYGSPDGHVTGTVCIDKPENWRVALYCYLAIQPPDPFFLLSDPANLTPINPDGTWSEICAVSDGDRHAQGFMAFLVPVGTVVPSCGHTGTPCQGIPIIPQAVTTTNQQRIPYVVYRGNPSTADGVRGYTNCDPRFYFVISYVQVQSGRVYPQPLSNPAGSDYEVPINSDGTFSHPLNQTSLGPVITDYDPSKAVAVRTEILPIGTDYVDAWPENVTTLMLNEHDDAAQVQVNLN